MNLRTETQSLAAKFPALMLAATKLADTVSAGVHGRRRAGTGDSFWQFRPYQYGDPAARVDWRQSAKGQHLFVREQEHETMETAHIWCKCGQSMDFQSPGAHHSKKHSALLMALTLGLLLQRGGEKFGLLGPKSKSHSGAIGFEKFSRDLLDHANRMNGLADSLPDSQILNRHSVVLLIGDFLEDPALTARTVKNITARGCSAHLLQIIDPAEEYFPYKGHLEFTDANGRSPVAFGRAEAVAEKYRREFIGHKDAIRDICRQYDCNLILHDSGRDESMALLAQYMALKERR